MQLYILDYRSLSLTNNFISSSFVSLLVEKTSLSNVVTVFFVKNSSSIILLSLTRSNKFLLKYSWNIPYVSVVRSWSWSSNKIIFISFLCFFSFPNSDRIEDERNLLQYFLSYLGIFPLLFDKIRWKKSTRRNWFLCLFNWIFLN